MRYILSLGLVLLATSASADDWAADWLQGSLTGGGPSSYNGATRDYMTMGNLSYRTRVSVDHPIRISPPRLKTMGCGGIDMFMGGISYMDMDMLVEKFEQMIQNGEVIAFQLAIKALSEKLGTTIEGIEAIINKLNNVQLDSCAMAKAAVTTVWDGGSASDAMGEVWSEISQGQDLSADGFKNAWDRAQDQRSTDNTPPASTQISREINACSSAVKEALLVDGSLLDYMSDQYGLTAYRDVIRGYVGDVLVDHSGPGNIPNPQPVPPCPGNDRTTVEDFIYGTSESKPTPTTTTLNPACYQNDNNINLTAITETNLRNLAEALRNPGVRTSDFPDLDDWISASPIPVYGIMKEAVNLRIEDEVIMELQNVIAYAFAYQIFDDLLKNSARMSSRLNSTLEGRSFDEAEAGADAEKKCNTKPYLNVISSYKKLGQTIRKQHSDIRNQYALQLESMTNRLNIVTRYESVGEKHRMKILGEKQ